MNCWRTINLKKEFGYLRLNLIAIFATFITFNILYIPFSMTHIDIEMYHVFFIPFLCIIFFIPMLHSFLHVLPLVLFNQHAKLKIKWVYKCIPTLTYHTKKPIPKLMILLALLAPTLFMTLPAIFAMYFFSNLYIYILIGISYHIGLSSYDFIYIHYLLRAPRHSVVTHDVNDIDILTKNY